MHRGTLNSGQWEVMQCAPCLIPSACQGVCTARLNRSTQLQCADGYRQGRSSSAPANALRETDPGLNGGRELHVTRTARRSAVWPRAPTSSAAYTARSSCCLHARIVGSLLRTILPVNTMDVDCTPEMAWEHLCQEEQSVLLHAHTLSRPGACRCALRV